MIKNLKAKVKDQVLLGITGSGKTYTMANVIAAVNKPTLVMAHNKTLAAHAETSVSGGDVARLDKVSEL